MSSTITNEFNMVTVVTDTLYSSSTTTLHSIPISSVVTIRSISLTSLPPTTSLLNIYSSAIVLTSSSDSLLSLTSRTNIVPISSTSITLYTSSSTTLSSTATTPSTSSISQTSSLISTPDSRFVTVTSSIIVPTTVPNDGGSITMPSSILGSDSHSDNRQTESTNSNVPNTQFNTIKNTITITTDRTIVSDKTTNTAPLVPSKTESIISTTASREPTIQSSTGDNNTTTLIAAVISTVLILLVVSILVIIIVSVLMYKRRKRLTLKISSGQDDFCHANPVYSDTTTVGDDKGMKDMSNPNYQSQGIILLLQSTICVFIYYKIAINRLTCMHCFSVHVQPFSV